MRSSSSSDGILNCPLPAPKKLVLFLTGLSLKGMIFATGSSLRSKMISLLALFSKDFISAKRSCSASQMLICTTNHTSELINHIIYNSFEFVNPALTPDLIIFAENYMKTLVKSKKRNYNSICRFLY